MPHTRLNWEAVNAIRSRYAANEDSMRDLATAYEVSQPTIHAIIGNRTWHHPDYTPPTPQQRFDRLRTTVSRKQAANARKRSPLTWEIVRAIRKRYASGETSMQALATAYEVSRSSVYKILRNRAWYDPDYHPVVFERVGTLASGAILTWPEVHAIRQRYASDESLSFPILAREYGIGATSIGMIIHNRSWYDPSYTPPVPKRGAKRGARKKVSS